jgi:ubiquinone/menaquinone biosynthesis C-methylase UbiE
MPSHGLIWIGPKGGEAPMTQSELSKRYVDGNTYEKFMGNWSRSAGQTFVEWLDLPANLDWLDVGCGTGAFTSVILDSCAPKSITGIDAMESQIVGVRKKVTDPRSSFDIGDAQALTFETHSFDAAVSALVLNFVVDHRKMVAEMKRVTRPQGTVATYIWDFAGVAEIAKHFSVAILARDPEGWSKVSAFRNSERTSLDALGSLFDEAQLEEVDTRPIEITVSFPDFDSYWAGNTAFTSTPIIYANGLPDEDRERLKAEVKALLPIAEDGSIEYMARVSAVRGTVPA